MQSASPYDVIDDATEVKPILYSSKQLCILLGITPTTIINWRTLGKGPKFITMTDSQVGYLHSDVMAWINENKTDPRTRARARLYRELAAMEMNDPDPSLPTAN
jgi:predicted DNA-binding transcriptional regulator AlpA